MNHLKEPSSFSSYRGDRNPLPLRCDDDDDDSCVVLHLPPRGLLLLRCTFFETKVEKRKTAKKQNLCIHTAYVTHRFLFLRAMRGALYLSTHTNTRKCFRFRIKMFLLWVVVIAGPPVCDDGGQ